MHKALTVLALGAALAATACGDEAENNAQAPQTVTNTETTAAADLGAIKSYLTEHTQALAATTEQMAEQGKAYRDLAVSTKFDYAQLLDTKRDDVKAVMDDLQKTWREANPLYEEAEGVVAGVPELSEFDVILDAGSDASDPESAVPFDVKLPSGKVLKQPGNFFFLTETSLFGTNKAFQAKGVSAPDLDGDGEVQFGEAVPDADHVMAFTRDMAAQAKELNAAAAKWQPEQSDAFQALVTMTPTMSEYFGQWKNSRFIAGSKAEEEGFVASSRLKDIEDILTGLVLIEQNIHEVTSRVDEAQAEQIQQELTGLREFAEDLRKKEASGTKFTAEQADTLGSQAQERAEAIAGQVSQAAGQLGIELES
ncbi:MAG TPA: hypothetical protein VN238_14210 [Solirubrobacteraceae bacterium]|nr:hypothetical protein [Solirubrobacteraceae bacterium]